MAHLVGGLSPFVLLTVVLPLAVVVLAVLLLVACKLCDVDLPNFWQATFAVVAIVVANVCVRMWLNVSGVPSDFNAEVLAPLFTSAVILAMTLSTNPFSALVVTIVYGMVCGALYIGVSALGNMMAGPPIV